MCTDIKTAVTFIDVTRLLRRVLTSSCCLPVAQGRLADAIGASAGGAAAAATMTGQDWANVGGGLAVGMSTVFGLLYLVRGLLLVVLMIASLAVIVVQ